MTETIWGEDEEGFGSLDESLISFRLCGPNEELSRKDQHDDEPVSSGDLAVLSSHREPRTQFTRKEKGKKKMLEYDNNREESDRSESDSGMNEDGPLGTKFESNKRALKSVH